MTKLQQLCQEFGQSPWLDNIKRGYITTGQLKKMAADGIRGLTSNPTIFQKAIEGSTDYDEQFRSLAKQGLSVEQAYWSMVVADISAALDILRPVHEASDGDDGFVSIELAPDLALETDKSIAAARELHERIDQPNLYVKIPGTANGVPAVRQMISEGRNINITLLFSLERYDEIIEAYVSGLEAFAAGGGNVADVHSVASFFVSRVDTEVDRRLEAMGTDEALALRGKAAVAQAQCAYKLFRQRSSGPRWDATEALFDLEPQLVESDYSGAFAQTVARFRRRALLVLLTELNEQAAEEYLVPALPLIARSHLIVVGSVRDPEVERWAAGAATESDSAFRRSAAIAALAQRARFSARLRSLGVTVVDAAPGRLSGELADAYLRLKATGRL